MIYDCAVIGTGPAGLSAALNLKIHNKRFLWLGSRKLSDKLLKAERVRNYPGFTDVTGAALGAAFQAQAEAMELEITEAMVSSIMPMGDHYALAAGPDFYETRTIILTTGVGQSGTLPGEAEKVGMGVSYCATCDGMLYRGRTVAVICGNPRFEHEVKYLSELAEKVYFLPSYRDAGGIAENVERVEARPAAIEGDTRAEAVRLRDGTVIPVDGVFCLRDSIALQTLLPSLETEDGHIAVDRTMATNLPGVFAAGDCTGRPYQYAKAVGEGNVAAHGVIYYYLIKTRHNPIASSNAVDNISREAIDRKAETVNHLIQGVEYFVSESHFANLFPDLLNGIHFWRIRWNISQVDVRRHFQFV